MSTNCIIIHFKIFHFLWGEGGIKGKSTIFILFSAFFFGKLPLVDLNTKWPVLNAIIALVSIGPYVQCSGIIFLFWAVGIMGTDFSILTVLKTLNRETL